GGAGGPGGPCFGFYAPGVTLNLSGATYQAGTPGTGGTGGAGAGAATSGQDGPDGVVGNVYN
ncbi:hypothetical protein KDM41_12160, partial [bacterium]|nr:hypothetical protein [bacterium]